MKTNAEILEDIIKSRRSIFPKDYTAEAIPQDVLDKILESANYAPSHKKTNPWRFRIFQGLEKQNWERLWQSYTKQPLLRKLSLRKIY